MKLFFLVLFMFAFCLFAQNEMRVVGKGEFQPSELIDKSIRDANGDVCAGLMIVTDLTGMRYDSYNGIVKVNQNPGKDFLFLSPDERVVEIFCSGFASLKIILSDYGIVLRKGEVWKLKVTGDKVSDLIPINIVVKPADAQIYIDDKLQNISAIQVSAGEHKVKIIKEGYQTIEEKINVAVGKTLFNYTLSEVELAKVQISSNPTGAKIYINGLEKGETNKGLFLFPGNYDVRLIKSGYLDKEEKIAVNTNKQNNFLYNLEKNAGTLNISVSPSSAVVLINKEKTTNRNIQLSPGKYKIEISENGYYDQSETIEVELGKTISKSFNLEPKVGKLQLSVSPPEAEVTLRKDGKIIKNWQGLELLKDLQVGEYEITVKNSGYETVNKRIEIIENQTTIYDTVLERTNLYRSNKNSNTSNVTKSVPEGMVFVEGGEFLMGSNDGDDDEKPVHKVKVNSFYIGKFEVTDLLYWSIMDPDAKYFDRYHAKCCISWDGAQKFINKFNEVTGKKYRLPTEAEWEYAARGGNKSKGFVFAGGNKIDLVGRYPGNKERTDKVGQFKPNELGIYDMSGNVWEWCQDWYSENYYYERTYDNPKGPESGEYKVLRGGSYLGGLTKINGEYSGNKLKVHDRDYDDPEDDDNNYGFRLVLDIE